MRLDKGLYIPLFICAAGLGIMLNLQACALNLPPVRLEGDRSDLDHLIGRWVGDYSSDQPGGRTGTITFILKIEEQVAHGDVLMTPRGADGPYQRFDPERSHAARTLTAPTESLSIAFVVNIDGIVAGQLDPYWDPDVRAEARTVFRGVLTEGTIKGTYVTTYANSLGQTTGRWQVSRMR